MIYPGISFAPCDPVTGRYTFEALKLWVADDHAKAHGLAVRVVCAGVTDVAHAIAIADGYRAVEIATNDYFIRRTD